LPNNPLSAFRSSTESSTYQSRLGEVASTSSTSLAVSPSSTFSRFQAATQPWRQPTSSLLPSQRFSRSQGLNPPRTCRPYFMPVPSLRFYPSRFLPPAEPHVLSNAVALLWLPRSLVAASSLCSSGLPRRYPFQASAYCRCSPMETRPHFKALLPASVRSHGWRIRPNHEP